jgi:hypothetical protein
MTMTLQVSSDRSPVFTEADGQLWADLVLLAPVLKAGGDELAEAMADGLVSELRRYDSELPEREEIVRAYAAHLDALLQAADRPIGEQAAAVHAVAAEHGRGGAAAKIPLANQVEFYRLGLRALYGAMLRPGGDGAGTADMTDAISTLWRIQDTWVQSMTAAYHRESREAIRWREQRRSALVASVLDGGITDTAAFLGVADELRLPHGSHYVVVALESAGHEHEEIRVLENRLSRAGVPSAWRMVPDAQMVVTGLVALGGADRRRVLMEVLSQTWGHRVGISPQFDTWDCAQRAVRFARLAMTGAPHGSGSVTVFNEAPLAVVAASAPEVLAEVARIVLGSLNQLPADDRQVLLNTLHTWLTCGGSTDATAKAMFCHPNTVRYRLNKITEHTGRCLTNPLAVTELTLALHADLLAGCA